MWRKNMNFREKSLELYREGKTVEEIQKVVGIPIELDTLKKWDEESRKFDSTKDLIKKSIKLKRKLKEKDKITDSQMEALNEELRDLSSEIIDINPDNLVAKKDLFNSLYNLREWAKAEVVGKEIIEVEEENVSVLNKLANISYKRKGYNDAIEYLEKIILLNPENENFKTKLEDIRRAAQTVEALYTKKITL